MKDKERSGRRQKFDDEELQELLDEDPTQSQQKLAEALSESRKSISIRLKSIRRSRSWGNGYHMS